MIGLLSGGMTLVTSVERIKAYIEILNDNFLISTKTLALYAKIGEKKVDEFMWDFDSLIVENAND